MSPFQSQRGLTATLTEDNTFLGPSVPISSMFLIAAVQIIGFSLLTVRSRKYAVSSSVSVPCVITTPQTSSIEKLLNYFGKRPHRLGIYVWAWNV